MQFSPCQPVVGNLFSHDYKKREGIFNSLEIASSQILQIFLKQFVFLIWSDISNISCLSYLSMTFDKFLIPITKTLGR